MRILHKEIVLQTNLIVTIPLVRPEGIPPHPFAQAEAICLHPPYVEGPGW